MTDDHKALVDLLRSQAGVATRSTKSKAADTIEALQARVNLLEEYYQAREAVTQEGLFSSTDEMLHRIDHARAALKGGE